MLEQKIYLKSEFAYVCVALDKSANGVRLKIEDLRTGVCSYLDPLELESLAWCEHRHLCQILNPSNVRWMDDEEHDGCETDK